MNKQKIVLVDIDGTVADISHRLHYIDKTIKRNSFVKVRNTTGKHIVRSIEGDSAFIESIEDSTGEWLYSLSDLKKVKNWRTFFEACPNDAPLVKNIQVVKALSSVYPVVFMSGRPEDYRVQTWEWLRKHSLGGLYYNHEVYDAEEITQVYMRPRNDTREDYIVKEELYRRYVEPYADPVVVIDDRTQVVDMWRKLGLNCWQVANGNF